MLGQELLFQPFKAGPLPLKNRMVFVPFETNYATEDSYPTERHASFYESVAAGGVGLILMEAANVNPQMIATKYGMGLTNDKYLDPLRKWWAEFTAMEPLWSCRLPTKAC